MTKETLTAKVSPKNLKRLEEYADREGISKSEATDRLVKQGLDVEESDMRLVPVRSDGGTIIEDRLDQIEKQQQDRLDGIEQQIKSTNTEKSVFEEYLENIQTAAIILTLGSMVAYILSIAGQMPISADTAYWSIGVSTTFLLIFIVIEDVIQND